MVKTVTVTGQSYITFAYTDKQINDIAKFCCKNSDTAILGVDTTFNLCDLWITDTSYRNKRLLNTTSGGHPVHLGPIMLHFTKDDGTCGRFALELLSANPCLKDLKTLGVDLEAAIYSGFKSLIPGLGRLICVRHLMKRDELKLRDLLPKTGRNIADRRRATSEIIKDIYGSKVDNYYEYGLAESIDSEEFDVKSLKDRWESLCPGFFNWSVARRKEEKKKKTILL